MFDSLDYQIAPLIQDVLAIVPTLKLGKIVQSFESSATEAERRLLLDKFKAEYETFLQPDTECSGTLENSAESGLDRLRCRWVRGSSNIPLFLFLIYIQ